MESYHIVLNDTIYVADGMIRVITSINGLNYRIEVLKNNISTDVLMESADELRYDPSSEELFKQIYTEMHKSMVDKYRNNTSPSNKEKSNQYSHNIYIPKQTTSATQAEQEPHQNYLFKVIKSINLIFSPMREFFVNHKLILSIILLSIALSFIIAGRVFICSNTAAKLLSGDADRAEYFSQLESICGKFTDGCIKLVKYGSDLDSGLYNINNCINACEDGTIDKEKCDLISSYVSLKENKENIDESNSSNNSIDGKTSIYNFKIMPDGNLTLEKGKIQVLSFSNNSSIPLDIKLHSIDLANSLHEEILQFRHGLISMHIMPNETKEFKLFLEPTYYDQFSRQNYQGKLTFIVSSADQEPPVQYIKYFEFTVE